MRKKLIIVVAALVVIVALVGVLLLNLEAIVNRNKEFLITRAENTLGREVTVGKIGVTLSGGIGVRLEDFSVADDPAFSDKPFIEAKDLQVNAKLLPLLRRQFQVKRVILHDPMIRLVRDENGNLSTSTLASGDKAEATTTEQADAASSASSTMPLAISLIDIDGGELHVVDRSQGLELRLAQIESKVEELDLEKPIKFALRAAFLSESQNISLEGTFGPLGRERRVESVPVDASASIDAIEVGALAQSLPTLQKALPPELDIAGPVSVALDAKGSLPAVMLDSRIDGTAASMRIPDVFNKAAGAPFVIHSQVQLSQSKATIENYEFRLHDLVATGRGEYRFETPPSIELSIDSKQVSLSSWNDVLPALKPYGLSGNASLAARVEGPMQPGTTPRVSGQATVSDASASMPQLMKPISGARAEITFTDKNAKVTSSSGTIGKSQVSATANIESFAPMVLTYQMNSPSLALDDVFPPNPKVKKPQVLNDLTVKGRMTVKEVPENQGDFVSRTGSVADIAYQNLSGKFSVVGKETNFSNTQLQALDGTVKGSGVITVHDRVPTFRVEAESRDLNMFMLFEKLPTASKSFLRGKANMNMSISGTGTEWVNTQKTLSGQGLAELFEGAVVDFNIFDNVLSQLSATAGVSNLISQNLKDRYPKVFKNRDTEFKNFKSDFVIENGKLLARNLQLIGEDYDFRGKGGIDFDRNLDLAVTLRLSKKLTADLIEDRPVASYLTNKEGVIEIPFGLVGTFPQARVTVDKGFVNKVVERALTQQGLDVLKKQPKDVRDFLNFGKKDKKESTPPDTTKK